MIVLFLAFSIPPDWVYLNAKTVQDRHTQRGIEMDNKVLDEAVEVLVTRLDLNPDYFGTEEIRESFLAGVKVLLGEPVAWQYRLRKGDHEWITAEGDLNADYGRDTWEVRRLYAPSLGEGDANA